LVSIFPEDPFRSTHNAMRNISSIPVCKAQEATSLIAEIVPLPLFPPPHPNLRVTQEILLTRPKKESQDPGCCVYLHPAPRSSSDARTPSYRRFNQSSQNLSSDGVTQNEHETKLPHAEPRERENFPASRNRKWFKEMRTETPPDDATDLMLLSSCQIRVLLLHRDYLCCYVELRPRIGVLMLHLCCWCFWKKLRGRRKRFVC
jgi:hypothetical protein